MPFLDKITIFVNGTLLAKKPLSSEPKLKPLLRNSLLSQHPLVQTWCTRTIFRRWSNSNTLCDRYNRNDRKRLRK